ncbi:MAG: protein kinase [Aphanothece sp. CMT-3BRIN-NPC111]|jgi:serine/threonine-protein kinase|nr:protein kinase [Aphanothece sp. CMT-3BRIN-NPC111]
MTLTLLNNRYRIIRALGSGGFGNTFLAEDSYMPSARRCVIKQLKPVAHDPQAYQLAQQRFQREAAVLEDLGEGSNQIPRLYAYFSEGGEFYLVQEWIEGETLSHKVQQQGPMSEGVVRDIVVSLLPVLDFVHSKRMVHRDIKPDNIIVRNRDGKPVLIDFGAVKEAMGNVTNSIMIGTPGFMPSEQAAGQPVYSSDLYSLALTAVCSLTGKAPQELQTDPGTGEILWQQYVPSVSPTFAAVLDKAIQSHPRDRFATAKEMLDTLQSGVAPPSPAWTATQPTVAVAPIAPRPATSASHTVPAIASPASPGQRLKPWLIAILIVGGLIVAALALSRILNRSSQSSPSISSSSPSASEQPVGERPSSQTPASLPSEPSQETPAPVISRSPSTTQTPEAQLSPTANPNPQDRESPSSAIPESPSSAPRQSPAPVPTPARNNRNPNPSTNVPAFPTGTSRSAVEAALGSPSKDSKGYYPGTRAVTYHFVPNQIDLGYLYDRSSGQIRQTEVAFAQSVDRQVMLATLDGMLGGGATAEIKRGLQRVQDGQSNSFTFKQGGLKIQIVRQDCGFIYISIWDADLHEFDVSSSRKC